MERGRRACRERTAAHSANRLGYSLVLAAAVLGLASDAAVAQGTYRFERLWPTLQQPWYFAWPGNVAVDEAGAVYTLDSGSARVQKFSSDGQLVAQWGREGDGPGEFQLPFGIATDGSGSVYVADTGNDRIQKFTSNGEFVAQWGSQGSGPGEFKAPFGVAADTFGSLYVLDTGNNRVQKLDANGAFLAAWGESGAGQGQFSGPEGIAADQAGAVYVADTWNNRIQKFDASGGFEREWGGPGSGNGQFQVPIGIAADRSGAVYVADSWNDRVQKFDGLGAYLGQWGTRGDAPGQLKTPEGIAVDRFGGVYVADFGNERIQKFTDGGAFLAAWEARGSGPGQFDSPEGVGLDSAGNVYVADTWNHRVQKFDSDGAYLVEWSSIAGQGLNKPVGVAVGSDDRIYVTDSGNNRVVSFNPDGASQASWGAPITKASKFQAPEGIAVDGAGNVYVADKQNHRIQKLDSAGVLLRQWGGLGGGEGQFRFPSGVAVDPAGLVYVADTGNARVQKFDGEGIFLAQWGTEGNGPGEFEAPFGIAVSAADTVFVVDSGNSRIQEFTTDGDLITVWGGLGTAPGEFVFPSAIAVDAGGTAFVADTSNHRIQKLQHVTVPDASKAIVVAAGGPFDGNNLWNATQMCANFAYRTLAYQGFTRHAIYYLSADTDLDLDGNGLPDDVDRDATKQNLHDAITEWAADAESLVVYLVDHGGAGTFRVGETEVLESGELRTWLDAVQATIPGTVTVVYDACQSGSFLDDLAGPNRIAITSAASGESAYFLSMGTISFSNFFWTQAFNGLSVLDSFTLARDAVGQTIGFQTPQMADAGNLAQTTFIGNHTAISGDAPEIGGVSPSQVINGTSTAALFAEPVSDADGIARVWAVIRAPDFAPASPSNPLLDLPFVNFTPTSETRWEGAYDGFTTPGTYLVAIYARDRIGNTSLPALTSVSVGAPLRHRAVIVAGGPEDDASWPAFDKAAALAYRALQFQGYRDNDDVYYLSPATTSTGVDGKANFTNVEHALTDWAAQGTQDLVVFLVGRGGNAMLSLNGTEALTAHTLDGWLDALQATIPGKVIVVIDANHAGTFVPLLMPPEGKERIVIASADANEDAHFLSNGVVSFSMFFWQRVLNGATVKSAYGHAAMAMLFSTGAQTAQLDDTGDGVANDTGDGLLAQRSMIGAGVLLAGDEPLIGAVCPPRTIGDNTEVLLWADGVTSTGAIDRVWAVVVRPDATGPKSALPGFDLVPLLPGASGRYEGRYTDADIPGVYDVTFLAMDTNGTLSLPKQTTITKEAGPDAFEDDDTSDQASWIGLDGPIQSHNFHDADDEDWVAFCVLETAHVSIKTDNLGTAVDTYIELYASDAETLLAHNDDDFTDEDPNDALSSYLIFRNAAPGVYYVRVSQGSANVPGVACTYDLRVWREIGMQTPGSILGQVVSSLTGQGIGGARVTVVQIGDYPNWITNANGEFYISAIDPGSYTVKATATGFATGNAPAFVAENGQAQPKITLTSTAPRLVVSSAKLSFETDGQPQNVTVTGQGVNTLAWTAEVTSGNEWLAIAPGAGVQGQSFAVTVQPNASTSARTGEIMVRADGVSNSPLKVSVQQKGQPSSSGTQCSSVKSFPSDPLNDTRGALSVAVILFACWAGSRRAASPRQRAIGVLHTPAEVR